MLFWFKSKNRYNDYIIDFSILTVSDWEDITLWTKFVRTITHKDLRHFRGKWKENIKISFKIYSLKLINLNEYFLRIRD